MALVVRGDCSLPCDTLSLCVHPVSLRVQPLRSIKELEHSLTRRALYTNAANIVAINCYQFVWLLPVRIVSVIIINYVNHLLVFYRAPMRGFSKFICTLLLEVFSNVKGILCSLCSIFYSFFFRSQSVNPGPAQVMLAYLFSTAWLYVSIIAVVRAVPLRSQ